MSIPNRAVLGCLGVIGLVFVGIGTLVVLNWEVVSNNLATALDTQAEKTQTTLFRLGEVMSIRAVLKAQYGAEPDVSYDTTTSGDRILSISFSDYQLLGKVASKSHAREIAVFAIGQTTKFEQIDVVKVLFRASSTNGVIETTSGSESYSFALEDLISDRRYVKPDDSAAE